MTLAAVHRRGCELPHAACRTPRCEARRFGEASPEERATVNPALDTECDGADFLALAELEAVDYAALQARRPRSRTTKRSRRWQKAAAASEAPSHASNALKIGSSSDASPGCRHAVCALVARPVPCHPKACYGPASPVQMTDSFFGYVSTLCCSQRACVYSLCCLSLFAQQHPTANHIAIRWLMSLCSLVA